MRGGNSLFRSEEESVFEVHDLASSKLDHKRLIGDEVTDGEVTNNPSIGHHVSSDVFFTIIESPFLLPCDRGVHDGKG